MKQNIRNGGVVIETPKVLLITDVVKYSGTVQVDLLTGEKKLLESLCWYMNQVEDDIYYCNQKEHFYIYRLNLENNQQSAILGEATRNLIVHQNRLYYINSKNNHLYWCNFEGKEVHKIIEEVVIEFSIGDEGINYKTSRGQKVANCDGSNRRIIDDQMVELVFKRSEIKSVSYIKYQNYLYCANENHERSLFRIGLDDESKIRVCNKPCNLLHLIKNRIYFLSTDGWWLFNCENGQLAQFQ